MGLREKVDYYIALSVFLQSFLVIFQQILIAVLGMDPESTTIYRALLSAIPMSIAIFISLKRRFLLFVKTYIVVMCILVINTFLYPQNSEFLWEGSLRFLLPLVIPSALCLMTIGNLDIVEKALYYVSWATFGLVLLYVIAYISGGFEFDGYNMAFSYGCLLPMISLYRKKQKISLLASFLLFLVVIAIGSRGAAAVFLCYLLVDIIQNNRRMVFFLLGGMIIGIVCLSSFSEWLDSIGIHSRTLMLLAEDAGHDSGRGELYAMFLQIMQEHPLGLGLFGDRIFLSGLYCHNIFLEMLVNWGYMGAIILWLIMIVKLWQIYTYSSHVNRNRIICYTLVLIAPLMVSSSYLINYNFGIYCGLLYLISKEKYTIKNCVRK